MDHKLVFTFKSKQLTHVLEIKKIYIYFAKVDLILSYLIYYIAVVNSLAAIISFLPSVMSALSPPRTPGFPGKDMRKP